MTVYDRIKQLADSRKMTVSEVEKALGMGVNSLYAWKTKIPNGTSLEKAADYFHVSVDYLLGRSPDVNYKFNDVPFSVRVIKHKDGQFEIITKNTATVNSDLLQNIDFAKSKVLKDVNSIPENNIISKLHTESRIEQIFLDELIKSGVEIISLKSDPIKNPRVRSLARQMDEDFSEDQLDALDSLIEQFFRNND